MIRDLINSAKIKAISYDETGSILIVETPGGKTARHAPVPYVLYSQIISSRFPDITYRKLIARHVLPPASD